MANKILVANQDQPQVITLNEKHMGDRCTIEMCRSWIKILEERYGYNVQYGPFDGFPKKGIKPRHWIAAQDMVN